MEVPVIVEGGNLLDPVAARSAGFEYEDVGENHGAEQPVTTVENAGYRNAQGNLYGTAMYGEELTTAVVGSRRYQTYDREQSENDTWALPMERSPFLKVVSSITTVKRV